MKRKKEKDSIYTVGRRYRALYLAEGVLGAMAAAKLFYDRYAAVIILIPLIYVFYRTRIKGRRQKLMWNLNLEFRDALSGLASALSAGYSMENCVGEALNDLRCIYSEEDLIVKEFVRLNEKVQLNATVEQAFFELAERTQIEDIHNFAWILYTAKRTGGDLLRITKSTSEIISERLEVNREIRTVIASKKLESNIMCIVPAAIIVYLRIGCPGFLDPLYQGVQGACIMTGLLAVYLAAYAAASRIVKIKV